MRTGAFREVTLSALNGSDRTKYYLSGTFKRTVANIRGSEMNQFNFRLNIDHTWNKSIRFGVSVAPSLNKEYRMWARCCDECGRLWRSSTSQPAVLSAVQ